MANWMSAQPSIYTGPMEFHVAAKVKAMHHWIRKGNDVKAALAAREAFSAVNVLLRKRPELLERLHR
jgi:hypothetical protein